MKKSFYFLMFLFNVSSCNGEKYNSNNVVSDSVKEPVFAGQFYSDDSVKLTLAIKTFLEDAKQPSSKNPIAIIVPHAGYIYSGQIAADAFNQVKGNDYDLIVVLGTNHTTPGFSGISVYTKGAFNTPLGLAKVDEDAAQELLKECSDVNANPAVHTKEHSIEVQLPFIKYLFPKAEILPLVVGESKMDVYKNFAKALTEVIKNKRALVVASSDLSHYPKFDDANEVDYKTLKSIVSLDASSIHSEMQTQLDKNISQLATCACGEAPIMAAVFAAKEMGANCGSVISYCNSGYNPIGNVDRVVGYGAVAIWKSEYPVQILPDANLIEPGYQFTSDDKKTLLKYARRTLEQYFATQTVPLLRDVNPEFDIKRGAFVTLRKHGELRGCIGHMAENAPLCAVIGGMALQAAFNDTRFNPLAYQELKEVEIEISVLTPFKEIESSDDIVLGRDGVVLKKDSKQAVFLPQVATETGWSKEKFLDQLCFKAGLSAGDWKEAKLFTFQADVFSETDFK